MVAKEFTHINLGEPILLRESCDDYDDHYLQRYVDDDEAAEETLSLCDLAVSNNSTEDYSWSATTEFSKGEQGNLSDDQDDFFEFSSEDFTASSFTYPKDNIIFCGKLIPYKENKNNNAVAEQKSHYSFNKPRNGSSKAQQQEKNMTCYKGAVTTQKYECDLSVKKVSTIASVKSSRWYLFAFGYGRFSTEKELRDIKNRQSRRIRPAATMFGLGGGGGETIKKSQNRSKGKSLWRLLRVLGCKSQQASAGVKASFGCVPHVCEAASA